MPDTDIQDALEANAVGPAEASGDAGSVKQHALRDQIEADRYLRTKDAASGTRRGLRFNKLAPPGAD